MKTHKRALPLGAALLAALLPALAHAARKPTMVRVSVLNVGQLRGNHVVLLQHAKTNTVLPIWIGAREAQAISMGLTNVKPARPLTHDLLASVVKALGARIQRVEVITIVNNVFIGRLRLKDARGRVHSIDARPSDLIALAVAAKCPVFVAQSVLKQAGIKRPSPAPRKGSGTQVF